MPVDCSGPSCEETLERNLPGVSVTEAPFWELVRPDPSSSRELLGTHETLYFCSDECVTEFIDD